MKGYKAFNEDLTCLNFQYEIGKEYELGEDEKLEICRNGFHFCKNIVDVYDYYSPNTHSRVCEIEAIGEIINEGNKFCTNKIKIIKEITGEEKKANTGNCNTGYCNAGDNNTGYWNTGDWNTGYWNTGDWNTGYCNTGDNNTGDKNTGDWNTGDWNTGDWNTGDWNTGYWNTGDWNTGYWNTGYCNTGDKNTGNKNTGDWNTGYWNTGDWNTGYWNTGDCNTGDKNTGNKNTGDWNTGNGNTGNGNTGNWNTGDWNTGNCNTGCFNTATPKLIIFNKISDWTIYDWKSSIARGILIKMPSDYTNVIWTDFENMTDKEKEEHKKSEVIGGLLKTKKIIVDRQKWFDDLSDEDKKEIYNLPNFDTEIFYKCTGIKIKEKEL